MGAIVTRAGKAGGPLSNPALHASQFSGVAVTGVTYQGKPYWAGEGAAGGDGQGHRYSQPSVGRGFSSPAGARLKDSPP